MILDIQLPYLRNKFVASSWSNPGLETNICLAPTLLTGRYPARHSLDVMNESIDTPDNENLFDVYTLEIVPTELFGVGYVPTDCWIRLDSFCNTTNCYVHLSFGRKISTVNYSESYLCYLSNGALLLAIPYIDSFNSFRRELVVYIRSSNASLDVDIDLTETKLLKNSDISNVLTYYANYKDKEELSYNIDGVYYEKPTAANLAIGKTVTRIKDDSQSTVNYIKIPTLKAYTFENKQYYLVDLTDGKPTPLISGFRDAAIYLMHDGIGKFLVFETNGSIVQITNSIVAISVDYLEDMSAALSWSLDLCILKVGMRLDRPEHAYVNNDNFWHVLNNLDYNLKLDVLAMDVNAPKCLTAPVMHSSPYCKALDSTYSQLTYQVINDAMCVSTWDYYVNRVMVPANEFGLNIISIPPNPNRMIPLISYLDGYVDSIYPDSVTEKHSGLRIGYAKDVRINKSRVVRIDNMLAPIVYDVTDRDNPVKLTEGKGYTSLEGSVRITDRIGRSNVFDLASTHLEVVKFTGRGFKVGDYNEHLGSHTLMYGNRTLVPFIDYIVHKGHVIFWDMRIPDQGEVTWIYQPTYLPQSDVLEYGFTYDNRINVTGEYLAFDPKNYHVIFDGKVLLPEDIDWEEPFVTSAPSLTNGRPYAIIKTSLSNTNDIDEMYQRRMEYEVNLNEIAEFKNLHMEFPKPSYSLFSDRYLLVSIFMNEVLKAAQNGEVDYRPSTVASFGLDKILIDHLPILHEGLDPATKDFDWTVVNLRGHAKQEPVAVSGNLYSFLDKVNETYLKGLVEMNRNFRIID